MKLLNSLNNRRFKHGAMATVVTVVFIAAVVIVNIIVGLLLERFPATVDLTEDQIYQLTQESIDYVETIDEPVNITICYPEDDFSVNQYGKQITEIINSYGKYNANISIQWVDLLEEPGIASQYSDYGVTTYSIIVESDKRVKVASLNDTLLTLQNQETQETVYQSSAEQVMTSAIQYVTDEEVLQVAVLTGHSEVAVAGLDSMLGDNNYEMQTLNITTQDIDPEIDVVAIYSPTTDYTTEELKKLDVFLDNDAQFGKTVLYIASYQQPKLPNLEAFLEEWGILIGDGVLAETDAANIYDTQGYSFAADYLTADLEDTESILMSLRDPSLPFLVQYSRPISAAWDAEGNRTAELLLESPDSTIIIPSEIPEGFTVEDAESGADTGVAAIGKRIKYDGTTPLVSSVIVFGSDGNFTTQLVGNSVFNNNEFTISTLNDLTGKESGVDIAAVSFDAQALNVTQEQFLIISILFMFVVPIATLVLGTIVWIRRRNK